MPQRSSESVQLLDGKALLTRRKESPYWQLKFRVGNTFVRKSTKQSDLAEAKDIAHDYYMDAIVKHRNDIPLVTRKFKSVAETVKERLQYEYDNNVGPVVNRDYVQAIDNWLIPFFGKYNVDTIELSHVKKFYAYRERKLKRQPARSTINTHATALSLVFDEAVAHNYVSPFRIPAVKLDRRSGKNGQKVGRRPDFTIEEYRQLYRFMRGWVRKGKRGKPTQMRYLMRDYVLFLANSGIRHGTESLSLVWNRIEAFEEDGRTYLMVTVDGKVGERPAIVRPNAKRYLERIIERAEDMQGMSFDDAIKHDKPVFRLPDGTVTKSLDQTFRKCLRDAGLYKCPRSKDNRSLYSLRHFYITQQIKKRNLDLLTLARQCGTSVPMLDKHYYHLDLYAHRRELSR